MWFSDLSFNFIKKIEGLDRLVNLEDLVLFNNLIEHLENMDTLIKLQVFSVGNNRISDRNEVRRRLIIKYLLLFKTKTYFKRLPC